MSALKEKGMSGGTAYQLRYLDIAKAIEQRHQMAETARNICDLVELPPCSNVLDIPCGNGRYAAAFAHLGHHAAGIDLSDELIDYARTHNPGPTYYVGDMRSPPTEQYDLLVSLFSSFGMGASEEDDLEILKSWYARLRVRGALVVETTDLERTINKLGGPDKTLLQEYGDCRRSFRLDSQTDILTMRFELDGVGSFDYSIRLYARNHFVEMLQQVGFVKVQVFGSFRGTVKRVEDCAIYTARRDP